MEPSDLDAVLKYVLSHKGPLNGSRFSWDIHCIPFWSNPEKRQVGLKLLCYRSVSSIEVQMAGMVLRQVEAFVMGVVAGTGIEEIGLVGGTGIGPVDKTSTILGGAQTLHGVAGGPNAGFVGNMQVAGAKAAGDPVALYHSIKSGGLVLMEAIVRVEPITSGKRILIHGVRDAAHSDVLQANVSSFDGLKSTDDYWVYSHGITYENGAPMGNWRLAG